MNPRSEQLVTLEAHLGIPPAVILHAYHHRYASEYSALNDDMVFLYNNDMTYN